MSMPNDRRGESLWESRHIKLVTRLPSLSLPLFSPSPLSPLFIPIIEESSESYSCDWLGSCCVVPFPLGKGLGEEVALSICATFSIGTTPCPTSPLFPLPPPLPLLPPFRLTMGDGGGMTLISGGVPSVSSSSAGSTVIIDLGTLAVVSVVTPLG